MNNLPNPACLVHTIGITAMKGVGFDKPEDDYMFSKCLGLAVLDKYREMPDEDLEGGNDKSFFSFTFRNKIIWAVANEVGGLTIMLPKEY